jgi:DNA mismatch repair protein MutS
VVRARAPWHFELASASRLLTDQLGTLDLKGFGVDELPLALCAAGALLQYVRDTQRSALPHIRALQVEQRSDALALDAATRRNLELDSSLSGNEQATLFAVLDSTMTAMGSRALRRALARPLRAHPRLRERYHAAGGIDAQSRRFETLRERLRGHWGSRAHSRARGAALGAAARSGAAARLAAPCRRCAPRSSASIHRCSASCAARSSSMASSTRCCAAPLPRSRHIRARRRRHRRRARPGAGPAARHCRATPTSFWPSSSSRERERSGIAGLKLGYNRVQGFFIEVARAQADRVPDDYVRRQTVKSAERFITPELKGFEDQVLGARERALAREKELYEAVLSALTDALDGLQRTAAAIALVDLLAALAERASALGWSEPTLVDETRLLIEGGRHPVVERFLETPFVPNDLSLHEGRRMLIITGPNMGGKSTYMRQVALIVVLAHLGSFVPASRAEIGPIDRIFTRIGAADDLAAGRSTFMVEMTETANILNNATEHSLVLMDEMGRGTSTFDGLSLARTVAHYIATRLRALTLFATHYFELTALADEIEGCANVHLDATEHGDSLVFLHAVKDGPASRSYGLQVAQLAGVPREIIAAARRTLQQLEARSARNALAYSPQVELPLSPPPEPSAQRERASELLARLAALDPDTLSPRAALELLFELHRIAAGALIRA